MALWLRWGLRAEKWECAVCMCMLLDCSGEEGLRGVTLLGCRETTEYAVAGLAMHDLLKAVGTRSRWVQAKRIWVWDLRPASKGGWVLWFSY
ncbi:hypothetical protein BDU57DRAFT_520684 [Ampelomyces quisqualis]|uniref:Uncharacterized protein n=1 Tax=Ampelomyces quisqualis TaxID=50730 RepID=A0A6A5QDL6_AMPQU|nr:hypothetical protein BDU57DRAFT_520684 [Ampelomyces quisqualis]